MSKDDEFSEDETTEDMINELASKGTDLTDDEVEILYNWVLSEKKKLDSNCLGIEYLNLVLLLLTQGLDS